MNGTIIYQIAACNTKNCQLKTDFSFKRKISPAVTAFYSQGLNHIDVTKSEAHSFFTSNSYKTMSKEIQKPNWWMNCSSVALTTCIIAGTYIQAQWPWQNLPLTSTKPLESSTSHKPKQTGHFAKWPTAISCILFWEAALSLCHSTKWTNGTQPERGQNAHGSVLAITTSAFNSIISWCLACKHHTHKINRHSCSATQEQHDLGNDM